MPIWIQIVDENDSQINHSFVLGAKVLTAIAVIAVHRSVQLMFRYVYCIYACMYVCMYVCTLISEFLNTLI
jgi:hypothetical protein